MELKFLEDVKNRITLEIQGVNHTFCNVLRKELWNDKHVKISAYNIKHPLVGSPCMIVETDGKKTPKQALQDAVKRLEKSSEALQKEVKTNIK